MNNLNWYIQRNEFRNGAKEVSLEIINFDRMNMLNVPIKLGKFSFVLNKSML